MELAERPAASPLRAQFCSVVQLSMKGPALAPLLPELFDANHQRALATDEVLITPDGPNVFDDFGKNALYGRCFMFMDALSPAVVKVIRAKAS